MIQTIEYTDGGMRAVWIDFIKPGEWRVRLYDYSQKKNFIEEHNFTKLTHAQAKARELVK